MVIMLFTQINTFKLIFTVNFYATSVKKCVDGLPNWGHMADNLFR